MLRMQHSISPNSLVSVPGPIQVSLYSGTKRSPCLNVTCTTGRTTCTSVLSIATFPEILLKQPYQQRITALNRPQKALARPCVAFVPVTVISCFALQFAFSALQANFTGDLKRLGGILSDCVSQIKGIQAAVLAADAANARDPMSGKWSLEVVWPLVRCTYWDIPWHYIFYTSLYITWG